MTQDSERILDEYHALGARAGDRTAFAHLARRWTPRLRRHARRMLGDAAQAEDVVQEAWLAISRRLPSLDDPARFPAWAYRITTRKCLDLMRGRARRRQALGERTGPSELEAAPAPLPDPDASIDAAAALAALAPLERILVSLYYGEGLTVSEIGHALELPSGTVKSRLFTARARMRAHLHGDLT